MTPVADSHVQSRPLPAAAATAVPGVLGRCGIAFAIAALVGGAVWASGALPVEARPFIGWGLLAAFVSGMVGMVVLTKFSTIRDDEDPGRVARMYVAGLGLFLALQIGVVTVALVAFSLQGQKFTALATFGLTFAAAVWVIQVAGSLAISRFLRLRAASTVDAAHANAPR